MCCVDDVLVVSHQPKKVMDDLSGNYNLKEGSVKYLDLYLGARICKHMIPGLDDPTKAKWAMSSDDYVKLAISSLEQEYNNIDSKLPKIMETYLSSGYRPALDS